MNHLQYGINSGENGITVFMDVPYQVIERAQSKDTLLSDTMRALEVKKNQYVTLRNNDDAVRITVQNRAIGKLASEVERREIATKTVSVVQGIERWSDPDEQDPRLCMYFGEQPYRDGRLAISADVSWPVVSEETEVASFATGVMRSVAHDLRYERKFITDLVYADVSRDRGVSLQTNPLGSCAIETNGMWYEPFEDRFRLEAHNIYNSVQQLICFAGAVAIVSADNHRLQGLQ